MSDPMVLRFWMVGSIAGLGLMVTACVTNEVGGPAPTPPPETVFPDWVAQPSTAEGLAPTLATAVCAPRTDNFALDRVRLISRASSALVRQANARAAALGETLGAETPLRFSRADLDGLAPFAEVDVAPDGVAPPPAAPTPGDDADAVVETAPNVQACVLMAAPEETTRALFVRVLEAAPNAPADPLAAFAAFVADTP